MIGELEDYVSMAGGSGNKSTDGGEDWETLWRTTVDRFPIGNY